MPLLHADGALLVFDKPAGLLSVPGRGEEKADCLSARVQAAFADALVVHRLDQATSGLFLMARGVEAQRRLSRTFESRQVRKRYVAVVHGRLEGDGWSAIDLPLGADWPNRPRQRVDRERGRPSRTLWRVLAHEGDRTRVELEPVTGRTHQLRVHLLAIGHPIVGDALYVPGTTDPRLLLHATELALPHPGTEASFAWRSDPPF